MATQRSCPAGISAHGLATTNQANIERLHHDLYHLVAELKAMISEVDRRLDGKVNEISTEVERLWGQIEE